MKARSLQTRRCDAVASIKGFLSAAILVFLLTLVTWLGAPHANAAAASPVFTTPLSAEQLDESAFAEWVDGTEKKVTLKTGTRHVIWTQNTQPEWNGVTFGESKISGARHLRIGWKAPLPVGSVLVRGGGQLSVLKPTAPFPGRLDRDEDWIVAQRIKGAQVSETEAEREEYALWVLPPGTSTRSLAIYPHQQSNRQKLRGLVGRCVCPARANG